MKQQILGGFYPNKTYSAKEIMHVYAKYVSIYDSATIPTTTRYDTILNEWNHIGIGDESHIVVTDPSSSYELQLFSTKFKLLPVTNHLNVLKTANKIELQRITFNPIAVSGDIVGESGEDLVWAAINDSARNPNWAYNQTRIRYSSMPTHQPNFFRPQIIINNTNIYDGQNYNTDLDLTIQNKRRDLSIGFDLPYQDDLKRFYDVPINTLDIFATCYQIIEAGNYRVGENNAFTLTNTILKRYPVQCELEFVVYK